MARFSSALLLLVILGTTACDGVFPIHKQTPAPRTGWLGRLFSQKACALPCWEGITPGKSTIEETTDIVSDLPGIKIWDIGSVPDIQLGIRLDEKDGGTILYENGLVSQIYFSISQPSDLEIQEIVNAFGDPDEVMIYDCLEKMILTNNCDIRIIYKENEMILHLLLPDIGKGDNQVEVRSDSKIAILELFPADDSADESLAHSPFGVQYLFPWNGFTRYP